MYEYKTIIGDDILSSDQVNEFAADGWELAFIVPWCDGIKSLERGQVAFYFRRPVVSH